MKATLKKLLTYIKKNWITILMAIAGLFLLFAMRGGFVIILLIIIGVVIYYGVKAAIKRKKE